MGGSGSSRWHRHTRKERVENCIELDIRRFAKHGVLGGEYESGWIDLVGTTYRAEYAVEGGMLTVTALFSYRSRVRYPIGQTVSVVTSKQPVGGPRFWFLCGGKVNDGLCGNRVRMLFLPPGATAFRCRRCHNLTYRSAQEAHCRFGGFGG